MPVQRVAVITLLFYLDGNDRRLKKPRPLGHLGMFSIIAFVLGSHRISIKINFYSWQDTNKNVLYIREGLPNFCWEMLEYK